MMTPATHTPTPYVSSLLWWIDRVRIHHGEYYRLHVSGSMQDVQYPGADVNGRAFSWAIPQLQSPGGGGLYVFRLAVQS